MFWENFLYTHVWCFFFNVCTGETVFTINFGGRLRKDVSSFFKIFWFQVSVSCGIPDFRSRDGIYARLAVDFPDLPDPQAMFDIEYFQRDPRPFFKFAKVCILPFFFFFYLYILNQDSFICAFCRKFTLGSFDHHFVTDLLQCWIRKRNFSGTTLRTLTPWNR